MKLRGAQGAELELRIEGYLNPGEEVDPWDSNALVVGVRVVSPRGTWAVSDPCLTTWEASGLARWLAALARTPLQRGARRHEPNLAVTARPVPGEPERLLLSFGLELESRPPWLAAGTRLAVDLDVTRDQIAAAAASLSRELKGFPRRGDDPTL